MLKLVKKYLIKNEKIFCWCDQKLNSIEQKDGSRECKVCHRVDRLTKEDKCEICKGIENISKDILNMDLFAVVPEKISESSLPLPFGYNLVALRKDEADKLEKMLN